MEQLLHYCWKHKLWPAKPLETTDGRLVEVIDPGLHNRNAGPDFFNAKVKIGGKCRDSRQSQRLVCAWA